MTRSMTRWTVAGCSALAALGAAAVFDVAPATADTLPISTASDPLGDTFKSNTPAYRDFVRGQLTRTAGGDYTLLMEVAEAVPASPPRHSQASNEMWWFWVFDLDPTVRPKGYPWHESGTQNPDWGRPPEFVVCVSWDGTRFAGTAIDRRPILTGGEAILTPVPFRINGTIIEADLASELLGAVAPFTWGPFTMDWSGPVGGEGCHFADYLETGLVSNP